jgi:hypothetical protein
MLAENTDIRARERLEVFELHRDMDRIEAHMNDMKVMVEHPYWRPEHTDRYLGLLAANLELLRVVWPWKEDEKAG